MRCVALLVLTLLPGLVLAQSLTLTAPTAPLAVEEGDDFAFSELGTRWDFDERRDVGWEENFDGGSISTAGGIWSGLNSAPGGYVFPLFPGFKGSLFAEGLPGDASLPRFGINHRIDSGKYNLLAYRLRHSARSSIALYWENNDAKAEYWPDLTSPMGASYDGYYHWQRPYVRTGWNIYSFDLKNLAGSFEQSRGAWSGGIFALRLDPSTAGGAGALTELDWMRLVDPGSAPTLDITWNSGGVSVLDVITVWIDDSPDGYDGAPVGVFTSGSNPGRFTLQTAMLPPGTYYFYITAERALNGSLSGQLQRSNYSAPLVVNPRPQAHFTSPAQTTGADYAATDLNNPWDMDSGSDIANLNQAIWPPVWRQFSQHSFVPENAEDGAVFQALADAPHTELGNTESDVQVHLHVDAGAPINPLNYRYLTYRLRADENAYPTLHDKVSRGWVSRPVFWNTDILNDSGRPKAHVLYEGWHTYTMDLGDPATLEGGTPWRSFSQITNLRLDPLETDRATWFWLDWVKLTADPRPENGGFTLSFTISSLAPGRAAEVELYYRVDDKQAPGVSIGTMSGLGLGSYSYRWDTSALASGHSYYPYLIVRDGSSSSKAEAPVPVAVGDPFGRHQTVGRAPMDYDGDGRSDYALYRPSTGVHYQSRSREGAWSLTWGGRSFTPVYGDIDGDGRTDVGLVIVLGGYYYWYITRSSDGGLYAPAWGVAGDEIVIADYDGDGRDEIAVFRIGEWFVLDESGAVYVHSWGLPGDIPLPRDYDGDGIDDLTVWRPSDGVWWMLLSSLINQGDAAPYAGIQFGLPGDLPIPGNWSGNGRAEPAVFRPGTCIWYFYNSTTSQTSALRWGSAGDIPIIGDFDGNGILDPTLLRRRKNTWYHYSPTGKARTVKFGRSSDVLPQKAH